MTNGNRHKADVLIVGGGVVGASIAYGLATEGARVGILDAEDSDFSASRGNFGMISISNKGFNNLAYFQLSFASSRMWPEFANTLREKTGIDPAFDLKGKIYISVGDPEFAAHAEKVAEYARRVGADYRHDILNRTDLQHMLGKVQLGERVAGGSFSPLDGIAEPLKLYSGLLNAVLLHGGWLLRDHRVARILHQNGLFTVEGQWGTLSAPRLVIAAGLGTPDLASQVGIPVKVRPQRGQMMVTERVEQSFPYPVSGLLRQNPEGTIMIGVSTEEVGYGDRTTVPVLKSLAMKAVERLPDLGSVQINRCWAALRPRTEDGYPVYQESLEFPGAFVITCHSGITLAALHKRLLPQWILGGRKDALLEPFGVGRLQIASAA
ncbi:FAD-binding oxidoreductase [Aquamicrobium sp. NLF2-7]|uniref:NAD(P)/FAD-dependent oxidoreductase n=1 Tax=Aquamicrobium sp. NLF2-7 TaxID=2918753 RepID=UPI001EFA7D64|nr:FAD-binding oxidoreductase [Aquamicrobium sp. NLF2-7]MCG8273948.1 FAD-binding oxidoreductase [Aquamicrobium sp. NLF2-7]